MLAALRTPDGEPLDLTLTTNGSLLARKAQALKDAGLQRVTVSLDALDDAIFRRMNDVDFPVADVLRRHRRRARAPGWRRSRSTWSSSAAPTTTRSCRWRATSASTTAATSCCASSSTWTSAPPTAGAWTRCCRRPRWCARIDARVPARAARRQRRRARPPSAGATRDGGGEIGVISSVTQAFCRDCNRARLSTEGKLFLCLFASRGHDLRALLRGGCSDAQIAAAIGADLAAAATTATPSCAARRRPTPAAAQRRVEMHYIGG